MKKVRIAFLHRPLDLRLEEVELPNLEPDQVLVNVQECGICGSDVECFEGRSAEGRYDVAPYTPGHEWAGVVEKVGARVGTLKVGDKVTGDCVMDCGCCRNCKLGLMPSACLNMRESGFRPDSPGGMGEYLVQEERFLHKFPATWSFEEGALVEPFSIGCFGFWGNGGYVDASDTVVILGGGMIGLCALITAKAASAKAIVVEPLKARRDLALKFGADEVINPAECSLKDEAHRLTDGTGASVIIEATGNDAAIASVFDIAGHSARVRLIGHSVGRKVPVEIGLTIWKTLSITGAGGTRAFTPKAITFMDRIRDRVDFRALISHRFPLEEVHRAFEVAKDKDHALKVMLDM